ncbi:hypothetical protein AVEN_16435-1 [Araneus ventricosus]|uniref:Uncharacterized protein n=1 Tax=Araneus ventricosus TaxID=182803 RepID=A0A4Y2HSA2_ARAVE|nr:hypothetical protein AVEN_16435-1 [Araneus ventricosus]
MESPPDLTELALSPFFCKISNEVTWVNRRNPRQTTKTERMGYSHLPRSPVKGQGGIDDPGASLGYCEMFSNLFIYLYGKEGRQENLSKFSRTHRTLETRSYS